MVEQFKKNPTIELLQSYHENITSKPVEEQIQLYKEMQKIVKKQNRENRKNKLETAIPYNQIIGYLQDQIENCIKEDQK